MATCAVSVLEVKPDKKLRETPDGVAVIISGADEHPLKNMSARLENIIFICNKPSISIGYYDMAKVPSETKKIYSDNRYM